MLHAFQRSLTGSMLIVCAFGLGVAHADWPNFRGARYDGISDETGFKTSWNESLPQVWEREIGSGFSSFACLGDKVYTCGTRSKKQVIFCFEADTGKTVWRKDIEQEFPESTGGDGPRATPTVSDGRVYILGAQGTLWCFDAETGERVWKHGFSYPPKWGYSGSVLIEGNLAIATGGQGDGALAALDKTTGQPVWTCGEDIAGYATPYPFTFEDTRYVVGFAGTSAIIAEAETGRLVWQMPWKTDWDVNAATPIYHDGHLFLTSGYKTGCALFKLRKDGDKLAADQVWKTDALRCKFQTPILYEGNLYGSDEQSLLCVDFMTGEKRWEQPRIKHGTVVLADGYLLLLTENGQLRIAKASPTAFEPLGTAEILSDRCWTVPVLHRGRLYARNLGRAVCYDLR
ncbi:MAG: PQQ-binding-like beta-propeller repeat protein [Phycisphaerales bacterium]|nr:MAG: PQQ-binding-like beta-propeller repeat protein [Phycisphaerales bacterium]